MCNNNAYDAVARLPVRRYCVVLKHDYCKNQSQICVRICAFGIMLKYLDDAYGTSTISSCDDATCQPFGTVVYFHHHLSNSLTLPCLHGQRKFANGSLEVFVTHHTPISVS
eukprot:m.119672 g.119672  ORF g.119672 m.119672 type:complete len:111 (-) comp13678_c2_seq8:2276-2608(-)